MSTSKHFGVICAVAVIVALALAAAVVVATLTPAAGSGTVRASRSASYEEHLFTTDAVHAIDIQMDDWDSFIAAAESEEYQLCTLVIDGETFANVGLRGKGNTSLSQVKSMGSQRYSFKAEFDHFDSAGSYYGLDKLSLNNLIQDNTMMKDYLVYTMMADFGVDAPLCSYAYLTVNGQDWGLYLAVEGVEESFLERNYGSEGGDLYKPDSMDMGGGRGNGRGFEMDAGSTGDVPGDMGGAESGAGDLGPRGADADGMPGGGGQTGGFPDGGADGMSGNDADATPGGRVPSGGPSFGEILGAGDVRGAAGGDAPDDSWQQGPGGQDSGMGGQGPDAGRGSADVKLQYIDDDASSYGNIFDNAKTAVTKADKTRLIAALKRLSSCESLESTVDVDEVMRYFVVHNFVCNQDSYTGSMVHNYYLYECGGVMSMIPWDYNLAFGTFQGGDATSTVNESIDSPVSSGDLSDRPMMAWIMSDDRYSSAYHELFGDFLDRWFSAGQLSELIEATRALIASYVADDPTKFCTSEEFEAGVSALQQFVALRAQAVADQLATGASSVDASGVVLSDMGTMGHGQGGTDFRGGQGMDDQGGFGARGEQGANGLFNRNAPARPNRLNSVR